MKDYVLTDNSYYSKIKDKKKTIHECVLFDNGDTIKVIMQKSNFTFSKIIRDDF